MSLEDDVRSMLSIALEGAQTPGSIIRYYGSCEVFSMALSRDENQLALGQNESSILILDAHTFQTIQVLEGHSDSVWGVDYSPINDILVSGSGDRTLRLWYLDTGGCIRVLHGHSGRINSVKFSPDGKNIASCSFDMTAKIWNVKNGSVLFSLTGSTNYVLDVAFNWNGTSVAAPDNNGGVRVWSCRTGRSIMTLNHGQSACGVAFSPDGMYLASCGGRGDLKVKLWEAESGNGVCTIITQHTDTIWRIAFSPDSVHIATASNDTTIRLHEALTGEAVAVFSGHTNKIQGIIFRMSTNTLLSCSWDNTVREWPAAFNSELDAFMNRYFQAKSGSMDVDSGPLNSATVVFIGEGRAGKTSSFRSICGKKFDPTLSSTRGADTDATVTVDRYEVANWREDKERNRLEHAMLSLMHAIETEEDGISADVIVAIEQSLAEPEPSHSSAQESTNDDEASAIIQPSDPPRSPTQPLPVFSEVASRSSPPTESPASVAQESGDHADIAQSVFLNVTWADSAEASSNLDDVIKECGEAIFQRVGRRKAAMPKSRDMMMRVFDLGGQSSFYIFHPFFITPHAVFPCVFDMEALLDSKKQQQSLLFLKQWWTTLNIHARSAPVLLVGTRADKVTQRTQHEEISKILHSTFCLDPISPAIQRNQKDELWFWPVDNTRSDSDEGIVSLRDAINEAAANLPVMQLEVPLKWMALYEGLKRENVDNTLPMMTISEVCAIAEDFGMSEDDVRICLQFLHKLGFVLHYHTIPGMSEVVILDIQWAVDMMTRIIRSFDLHSVLVDREAREHAELWDLLVNKGQLSKRLLDVLWGDMTEAMRNAFLDLMVRYTLLVPLRFSKSDDMSLLSPHILNFSLTSVESASKWSLSCYAATKDPAHDYDPAQDLCSTSKKPAAYIAFSSSPLIGQQRVSFASSVSVKVLKERCFVPEGLFACIAGLVVGMNSQRLGSEPEISRTACNIVVEGEVLSLRLIPSIGAIRFETSASRPTYFFLMVLEVVKLVLSELFRPMSMTTLLPHSSEALLSFEAVVHASREKSPLFVGTRRLEFVQLKRSYDPWLPLLGVQDEYQVFISYRQSVNSQVALQLYHQITGRHHLSVFLDEYSLELGLDFKMSFMDAICNSRVVCPLVSAGAISRMSEIGTASFDCDNLLLEWWCAIVVAEIVAHARMPDAPAHILEAASRIKTQRVVPVVLSSCWSNADMPKSLIHADTFEDLLSAASRLPDLVPNATLAQLKTFCARSFGSEYIVEPLCVREIVKRLLRFSALKCWDASEKMQDGSQAPVAEGMKVNKRARINEISQKIKAVVVGVCERLEAPKARANQPRQQQYYEHHGEEEEKTSKKIAEEEEEEEEATKRKSHDDRVTEQPSTSTSLMTWKHALASFVVVGMLSVLVGIFIGRKLQ